MNWYKRYNEKQRTQLKQADVILEDREYSSDETEKMYNEVVAHIFSQSKKNMGNERIKYVDFLDDFKKEM